jgi:hypothetical protein
LGDFNEPEKDDKHLVACRVIIDLNEGRLFRNAGIQLVQSPWQGDTIQACP